MDGRSAKRIASERRAMIKRDKKQYAAAIDPDDAQSSILCIILLVRCIHPLRPPDLIMIEARERERKREKDQRSDQYQNGLGFSNKNASQPSFVQNDHLHDSGQAHVRIYEQILMGLFVSLKGLN